jgi:hypothetical protein
VKVDPIGFLRWLLAIVGGCYFFEDLVSRFSRVWVFEIHLIGLVCSFQRERERAIELKNNNNNNKIIFKESREYTR